MKFQIKIIIAFSLVLGVVLFYINTTMINFMDYMKEEYILQSLNKKETSKGDFIEQKFQEYVKNLLLWQSLLVLSLMLVLYKVIYRMLKHEKNYKDFLELILLLISHKFGNFLASVRGNIEILKISHDRKALDRLEKSYNFLQEDFQKIQNSITHFKEISDTKEKINLKEVIEKDLSLIAPLTKVILNLKDISITANRYAVENIVFSLIENAVKYSKSMIQIRLSKNCLAIRNDIAETEHGSGVGLKITEALAKREGFKLNCRAKGKAYIAILKLT